MDNWQGLLSWSTKYHDGTQASNVQMMSQEDKEWLEAAMKDYTYNDADKLKQLCDELKADIDSGFQRKDMIDKLDEVQEISEIHERNNLNLCLCGGLKSLLEYMMKHPDNNVRKMACNTFSGVVQNNAEVQQFALRFGSLNLMHTFVQEKDMKNREAVFGALSSFLRSENFNSKREFIGKMGGLQFLAGTLGEKSNSDRLLKKVLILMYDLALNDENIIEQNQLIVRKTFGEQMDILQRLMELLSQASDRIGDSQMWDTREYILRILFRVFQICPQGLATYAQQLLAIREKLQKALRPADQDTRELISKELEKMEKVLKAPNLPIEKNYKKENIPSTSQGDLKGAIPIKM